MSPSVKKDRDTKVLMSTRDTGSNLIGTDHSLSRCSPHTDFMLMERHAYVLCLCDVVCPALTF